MASRRGGARVGVDGRREEKARRKGENDKKRKKFQVASRIEKANPFLRFVYV